MRRFTCLAALGVLLAHASIALPAQTGSLRVEGNRFTLTTSAGKRLTSSDLVGAVFEAKDADGASITVRLDAVAPAAERASVLLHTFSVRDRKTETWQPLCHADASGRRAGFPVAGRWSAQGRFVKDPQTWFVTCTSGSQGKCILWGYDPWRRGPGGEDLAPYYEACQHLVRADYDGKGAAHTRDGTEIDIWDAAGIQKPETLANPDFSFEAGWAAAGAVCVARTRWPDVLPLQELLRTAPRLAAKPCDPAEARRRGAILFNRSR